MPNYQSYEYSATKYRRTLAMTDSASPSYEAQLGPEAPPPYTFPTSFKIGWQTPSPLVTPAQLKGHLAILRAFHGLRCVIEDAKDDRIPTWVKAMESERRWAWYVGLAVERFERWCKSSPHWAKDSSINDHLPPCDVVMVWHAYLLNPR
jgi:hypothetical protein